MTFKFNAVVAAAMTLAAATSAHANFQFGDSSSFGNSSAAFVAIDNGGNISLSVDLGATLTSFLAASSLTSGAGALSAPGTVATWNFATNAYTLNGSAVSGTYNWSGQVAGFLANSNVTGNGYQWGVIAADGLNGAVSGSNVVRGQNLLFTGVAPDFDVTVDGVTSGHVSNSAGNVSNFFASTNGTGTHSTTVKGASTSTGGPTFLGTTLAINNVGDFGGGSFATNNYLVDPTAVSYFTWASSIPAVTLYSLGGTNQAGGLSATASTFTWNAATSTLTYAVPVPEPETYALMLAGLGVVAAAARRRKRG
jgi:hypothetical protein